MNACSYRYLQKNVYNKINRKKQMWSDGVNYTTRNANTEMREVATFLGSPCVFAGRASGRGWERRGFEISCYYKVSQKSKKQLQIAVHSWCSCKGILCFSKRCTQTCKRYMHMGTLTNFLQSISMFSTLMSLHRVVFQSPKLLFTRAITSHRFFNITTSLQKYKVNAYWLLSVNK